MADIELDVGDKVVVATLAGSRCQATGRIELIDFINEYVAVETEFNKMRAEQQRRDKADGSETWRTLGSRG